MTAALIAPPTARASCADDCSERTTLFRPTQKRPTWKDVERERAVRAAAPPALEVTHYFPKEGRTHPARLSVVPPLALAPPKALCAAPAHVPPYLKPGYWKGSPRLGHELHEQMRRDMGKAATIRSCPKALGELLNTPGWRGSTVGEPSHSEIVMLRAHASDTAHRARQMVGKAKGASATRSAVARAGSLEARAERAHEAVKLTHPTGATLLWLPLEGR